MQTSLSPSSAEQVSATGWIYDNFCLYMNGLAIDGTNITYGVPDHTVGCMQLKACVDSGFVVRQLSTSGAYTTAYNLSDKSTPTISTFLKSLSRTNNVYAKVRDITNT